MNKRFFCLVPFVVALAGCGSDDMSSDAAAKMKADLSKGGDRNAMSSDQKAKFDEYMKNRGMSAPSAPSGGK